MIEIADLFSKKQIVGLDIGSRFLKLVEIVDTSEGYSLSNFSMTSLDRGVIVDGLLREPGMLSRKIKELFKASGCKAKWVASSLSGHSVITKRISLEKMEEDELRELLNDEAEKYLPFDDMEDVNFDFQILGDSDNIPNQMEVVVVAAKKDIIDSYTRAIEKAGLKAAIMDMDSFALETMYEANYDFEAGDIVVLVNIGASITNINVLKNGCSVFTRDFPIGGTNITEALQEKKGVTFEDAEADILKIGEMDEDEGSKLREDLISLADPLFWELERSIDYFRSTFIGEDIDCVLVSGGCAKIPGLVSALSQKLGIEAGIVNPFKNISYDKKIFKKGYLEDIGSIAAVGVGLALRRIGDR